MIYITANEFARECGLSIHHIYRELRAGKVKDARHEGRTWAIPVSAIDEQRAQFSKLPPPPKGSLTWYDDRYYEINIPVETVPEELVRYYTESRIHSAEINGDMFHAFLPSVTTYLEATPKPYLAQWRGDIGNREANLRGREAAERGSRIHHACATVAAGQAVVCDPAKHPRYTVAELREMDAFVLNDQEEYHDCWKFIRWIEAVRPVTHEIESTVYSIEHWFAGTLDLLATIQEGQYDVNGSKPIAIPGGMYIVDLKTGKTLSDDYWMQLSAYAMAVREAGYDITGAIIIHTGAQTKSGIEGLATKLRTMDELKEDFEDFRAVKRVWLRNNASMKPRVFSMPDVLRLDPSLVAKAPAKPIIYTASEASSVASATIELFS